MTIQKCLVVIFFFQAEDGIRDGRVTGVQTCALPIYAGYLGLGLLTLTYTDDWAYGVRAASAMLGNLLFLFMVINVVKSPAQARVAIVCWLAMTAAIGLFTIYQWHNPAAVISEDRFQSTGERVGEQRFSTVLSDKSEYQLLEETPRALGSTSHPAVYGINVIL